MSYSLLSCLFALLLTSRASYRWIPVQLIPTYSFFHGLNTFLLYFQSHWFNKTGTDRWTRCQFKHDAVASGPFFFEAKKLQGIPSVWVWSWKPTLYKWSPRVWVCGCGFLLCICSSCSFTAFLIQLSFFPFQYWHFLTRDRNAAQVFNISFSWFNMYNFFSPQTGILNFVWIDSEHTIHRGVNFH